MTGRLLTVHDVAAMTGLSAYTVKEEVVRGELVCARIGRGRYRMFEQAAVLRYCARVGLSCGPVPDRRRRR